MVEFDLVEEAHEQSATQRPSRHRNKGQEHCNHNLNPRVTHRLEEVAVVAIIHRHSVAQVSSRDRLREFDHVRRQGVGGNPVEDTIPVDIAKRHALVGHSIFIDPPDVHLSFGWPLGNKVEFPQSAFFLRQFVWKTGIISPRIPCPFGKSMRPSAGWMLTPVQVCMLNMIAAACRCAPIVDNDMVALPFLLRGTAPGLFSDGNVGTSVVKPITEAGAPVGRIAHFVGASSVRGDVEIASAFILIKQIAGVV